MDNEPPKNEEPFVPPAFEQTIVRSKSQEIEASILPEDKASLPIQATDTAHIPIEHLAHKGKEIHFDDTGEMQTGPAIERPSYVIQRVLGRGGMGVVCAAEQLSLGRELAIKVALKISHDSATTTMAELEQFANEAVITARLDHPNVVPVHSLSRDDRGRLFFTMKQVTGISWEELLEPGRVRNRKAREEVEARSKAMSMEDHLDILLSVADAVAYAHDKGVIHRDLKPENVMIGSFGEVLVMDWGLAMGFGENNPYALDPSRKPQLVGTPAYLAPEMARGQMTLFGPHTDIYLLGGILYRLLTGRPPHTGESVVAAVHHAARGEIEPPEKIRHDPRITPELSRIVLRALAIHPQDRYARVQDFQAELKQYLAHSESLSITANGKRRLDLLKEAWTHHEGDETRLQQIGNKEAAKAYGQLSECVGALRQALGLWPENGEAAEALLSATSFQIQLALDQGDLTLARSFLEMFEDQAPTGKQAMEERWRRRRDRFRKQLTKQQAAQDDLIHRERRQRRLLRSIVLLLLAVGLAVLVLVLQQRELALDNLRMAEDQRELARESQRSTESMQKRMLAQATSARAALVDHHLKRITQAVRQYRDQAAELLRMPAGHLPWAARTPAGRNGFYLDEDYYAERLKPTDMKTDERYGQPVSLRHAVVKLAPWARQAHARHRALDEAARLSRLSPFVGHLLNFNRDVLYVVLGAESGGLVSFPGSGRFANKPEYDPTKRSWYRQAAAHEQDDPLWTDPHIDAGGKGLLLTCANPIRIDGALRGVAAIEMSAQELQHLLSDFTRSAGGQARGLLLRADGQIILDTIYEADPDHWQKEFKLQSIESLDPALASLASGAWKAEKDFSSAIEIDTAAGRKLVSLARLPHLNWMLLVAIDRSAVIHTRP